MDSDVLAIGAVGVVWAAALLLFVGVPRDVDGARDTSDQMKSPEQRRSPRYLTDWSAQYRLDPDDEWRACLVLDVSLDGAALELSDTALVGGLGLLHLQIASVADDQPGVVIRAVIRRTSQADGGRVIVGVEFSVLRADERQLLQLLVGLRAQP